jgi:hypothetical protein
MCSVATECTNQRDEGRECLVRVERMIQRDGSVSGSLNAFNDSP